MNNKKKIENLNYTILQYEIVWKMHTKSVDHEVELRLG